MTELISYDVISRTHLNGTTGERDGLPT